MSCFMEDFLLFDEQLNNEEKQIRDVVRSWVDAKFNPLILDAYEKAQFPKQIIPELAHLGILGMTLPETYGGSAASYVAYGLVCQELERGDSGLRSFVSVQNSLSLFAIFQFGNEAQKKRFLPNMINGTCIGCFGLTESDSGSDPSGMKTIAKKVTGGWQLNGSKLWITNATLSDIAIVWARTEQGIRGFIVEKNTPGFSVNVIHHKLSMRASDTGELVFNQCFVPDSHYLEKSEVGIKAPLSCLTQARYGIAWGAMGAAEACFDIAKAYVLERKQFNKPIAGFQLIQKELADILTEIVKTKSLNFQVGRLMDLGQAKPEHISLIKMNGARAALDIARRCRNLLGANGISLEYRVIRHLANLETVFTYEGTDNIHHLILGQYITGLNAFS